MSKKANSDRVLTPELLRIIKIFGVASIGLVLILSFFNERRANNTGEDQTFRMTEANRIYFLNLKAIKYNREVRQDAGMTIFRHKKLTNESDSLGLNLMIILNSQKDEAYIYLEPENIDWPLELKLESENQLEEVFFQNGNKSDHFEMFQKLKPYLEARGSIELKIENEWIPIWGTPKEKDALLDLIKDYEKLID